MTNAPSEERPSLRDHGRLTSRAAMASVATALFLLGLKGAAALQTGSVSMLGSLADTALDLVASAVTLFGVRIAAAPADHDHRFGHGKAEALVALFQVALIAMAALGILIRAIGQVQTGGRTANAEFGIWISLVAIGATMILLVYQRHVIARTGSMAIRTDHLHYQSDLFLNIAVMAALALESYAHVRGADAVLGIVIAIWLGWGAWRSSTHAIDQLMDKEWPEDKRRRFVEAAARIHPEVRGLHALRTRTSGVQDFVQFHLEVDPALSVARAHDIVEAVENGLQHAFPGLDVHIHLDPEGHVDEPGNNLAEQDEFRALQRHRL